MGMIQDSVTAGSTANTLAGLSSKMTAAVLAQLVVLQAAAANSAPIFIGDSTVSASEGHELVAGASLTLAVGQAPIKLDTIWAFAASNQRLNIMVVPA